MTIRSRFLGLIPICTVALVVSATSSQAQTLDEAKALYTTAAYTEALTALGQLPDEAVTQEVRRYRALCLLALGRRTDAEREVVAAVQADPYYVPSGDEVTPRMVTMFGDVRKRHLPALVQREFVAATRVFLDDGGPKARFAFERLLQLLSDPLVADSTELAELRTVVARFADRLHETSAPVPAPALDGAQDFALADGLDTDNQPAAPTP